MNISRKLYFGSLFLFTLACSDHKNVTTRELVNFQVDDILLPIGPEIDPYTKTMQYRDGLLYWQNETRSTISSFDLETKKIERVIKYEYDGPNGVGSVAGFYMFDPEFIVFPNLNQRTLNLLSLADGKVEKIKLYEINPDISGIRSMTRYTSTMYFWKNNFILPQAIYFRSVKELNEETLKSFHPFVGLDLEKKTVRNIPFNFTKSSFENKFNSLSFLIGYKLQYAYILPYNSNQINIFDLETEENNVYNLSSNLIPEFTNTYFLNESRYNMSIEENLRQYYSEPINFGIMVDPYKNLLYRMTWAGSGVPEGMSSMKFGGMPSHFILSVYDGDFNLKYEFDLPKYEYIPHQDFVSEKGLHLFGNHPDHPESKEDQIRIFTFDFSK